MKMKWTEADIPCQAGKIVVITGANSGLGFHTSLALARKGAKVIMACRNLEKGEEARQELLATRPDYEPELWELDLSMLSSVSAFAEKFQAKHQGPDVLINNAGVMALPYMKTSDGFEMHFGVNHLGHFALTALLWPGISKRPGARIVNVSSAAHNSGRIKFEDIHWERDYKKWGAYGMSKLANLLFTSEMTRRLKDSEFKVLVASAHPGYADTSLVAKGMNVSGLNKTGGIVNAANRILAQSGAMGALPSLYAATDSRVKPGSFYGPSGFLRMYGWPALTRPNLKRVTPQDATSLWELSESLTGIKFEIG